MKRAIIIHGHFYQPPRENPWLDIVLKQPSASPYHDWNERVNAECYAPNSVSRILNKQGKITRLVNNYNKISFNFGPTLMKWLMKHCPTVYSRIIKADRTSKVKHQGHGNALAQCYNHIIMPLANRQDKITQVLWGIKDFVFHFGRRPEGMWLPETAVDLETLDILATHGIKFTILSPHQADSVKPIEGKRWKKIDSGNIDVSQPYLQRLPSGREIVIFFYNGAVSHQVAFGDLLKNGDRFARRLLEEPLKSKKHPLLCIATDGETYGHHHKFAEMALSYAIAKIEETEEAEITNFGEYLENTELHTEVRIKENTSWSCVHGIERWRSDCGCTTPTQQGWTQQWRAPLRKALDFLRDHLIKTFQEYGTDIFVNPWDARNNYIEVLLNRDNKGNFIKNNIKPAVSKKDMDVAFKLLEMQKNALFMYTSCGWFFDEPSRPETIQILSYGLRAVELYEKITSKSLLNDFLEILSEGKSNISEIGTMADLFRKRVMPLLIDREDAALIGAFYFSTNPTEKTYKRGNLIINRESSTNITINNHYYKEKLHIEFTSTNEIFTAVVRVENPDSADIRVAVEGSKQTYTLKDLIAEEKEHYMEELLNRKTEPFFSLQKRLYKELVPVLSFYHSSNSELPFTVKSTIEIVLHSVLVDILKRADFPALTDILSILQNVSLKLKAEEYEFLFRKFLERNFKMIADKMDMALVEEAVQCIKACRRLDFPINLWTIQNIFYEMLSIHYKNKSLPEEIKSLGDLLFFDIEQIKEQIDSE